jgi:hypothetical protein
VLLSCRTAPLMIVCASHTVRAHAQIYDLETRYLEGCNPHANALTGARAAARVCAEARSCMLREHPAHTISERRGGSSCSRGHSSMGTDRTRCCWCTCCVLCVAPTGAPQATRACARAWAPRRPARRSRRRQRTASSAAAAPPQRRARQRDAAHAWLLHALLNPSTQPAACVVRCMLLQRSLHKWHTRGCATAHTPR